MLRDLNWAVQTAHALFLALPAPELPPARTLLFAHLPPQRKLPAPASLPMEALLASLCTSLNIRDAHLPAVSAWCRAPSAHPARPLGVQRKLEVFLGPALQQQSAALRRSQDLDASRRRHLNLLGALYVTKPGTQGRTALFC